MAPGIHGAQVPASGILAVTAEENTEAEKASYQASLIGKNPPAVPETLVRFLGQEDPLEKGQATQIGRASCRERV